MQNTCKRFGVEKTYKSTLLQDEGFSRNYVALLSDALRKYVKM